MSDQNWIIHTDGDGTEYVGQEFQTKRAEKLTVILLPFLKERLAELREKGTRIRVSPRSSESVTTFLLLSGKKSGNIRIVTTLDFWKENLERLPEEERANGLLNTLYLALCRSKLVSEIEGDFYLSQVFPELVED